VIERGGHDGDSRKRRAVAKVDRFAVALRPQLFAYQLLYELAPT
jgi:hypothetical protein